LKSEGGVEDLSDLTPETSHLSPRPGTRVRPGQIGFVLRVLPLRPGQIGFVLHVSLLGRATPHATAIAQISQSPQVWLCFAHFRPSAASGRGQIGFVLHISLPGRATPHTMTHLSYIPQSAQVWLRFARSPPSAGPGGKKLGSFRTIRSPNWVRFAHLSSGDRPRAGEIGFVLHNHSPAGHRGPPARAQSRARGANWVRFAQIVTTEARRAQRGLRPQLKPVLSPRRKERQEDRMAVRFTFAILASWRET
jgi:hypothetical protein